MRTPPILGRASSSLDHAEVRDVLAWMRLLCDPQDAAAVVRALARPPIELRQVELARVIQVARRRKLDLIVGLDAAIESPRVPPEARERIQRFLGLHARVAADFHAQTPVVFLDGLIRRLRMDGRPLFQTRESEGAGLRELRQLAGDLVREAPLASSRDLALHLAAVVPVAPPQRPAHEPDGELHDTLALLRAEVLDGVVRIGGRLGELRLDTDLDISHGVARYLELLKVSALAQRPSGQSLADALADINARLLAAATSLQREILQTSTLDHTIAELDGPDVAARERALASSLAPREQHSLDPFLPRRGVGLALSASDIHTYRSCPLRYKYARVLRIPVEQTVHQRFGIVVHQVLERYHSDGAVTLTQMLGLLDGCWQRAGFGDGQRERELRQKATAALTRYHARLKAHESQPVWFERAFDFRIGPHHLRGRVDRVDRLHDGAPAHHELIDYKTSRPKSPEQLERDIQLSLYALAAREDWGLHRTQQAYYYVLDDVKVPVPLDADSRQSVEAVVLEVGDGILAQEFEPTPSPAACSMCDYRIVCPVAEA